MRALVYHGSGNVSIDMVPKPHIEEPTDVILKARKLPFFPFPSHALCRCR